jgi:subtilisin family serine protease
VVTVIRMRMIAVISLLVVLMAAPPSAFALPTHAADSAQGAAQGPMAPDRLVVQLASGVGTMAAFNAVVAAGGGSIESLDGLGLHVVRVPASALDRVAGALSRSPLFDLVEYDPVMEIQRVPNDPYWFDQWGLARVNAPAAWDISTGSNKVVVAVVDTGVKSSHPDLQGALVPGRNILTGTSNTEDDHFEGNVFIGHGTMVAGVLAARTDNGIGVAGTCWTCSIMPVKVLGSDGSGYATDAARGIVWAADNGAQIINLSLGSTDDSKAVRDAVAYAHAKGIVVVSASGNSGVTTKNYPAAYPGVVSVAGSTQSDGRYSWSNYGSWVDVAAPGCAPTTYPDGGYGEMCGTSAASPIVAGVIGLALSAEPGLGREAIIDALTGTAVHVGSYVAFGRIDAAATLTASGLAGDQIDEEIDEEATTDGAATGSAACPGDVPPHEFTDVVVGSTHEGAIACITWWGIAATSTTYRPTENVTRAQMASFIARVLVEAGVTLPTIDPDAEPVFSDVTGTGAHSTAINQLAELKVVGGHGDGTYRPGASVTRAQMATFIARSLAKAGVALPVLDPGSVSYFSDVTGAGAHDTAINQLAYLEVVGGLGDGTYGPGADVRRAPMATFLRNTLDRLVLEDKAVLPAE